MKIAVVQIRPTAGRIAHNINIHLRWIDQAAAEGAHLIIFPELSLTGYEPTLAAGLAMTADDPRLDRFQARSDQTDAVIGIGLPTPHPHGGVCISMILFRPHSAPLIYAKRHLHVDEYPYFVAGDNFPVLPVGPYKVGLAICYEIAVETHAQAALMAGADVYIASVSKHRRGMNDAAANLRKLAASHRIPTMIANNLGPSDNFLASGGTAVWDATGTLVQQLDDQREGFLIFELNHDQPQPDSTSRP